MQNLHLVRQSPFPPFDDQRVRAVRRGFPFRVENGLVDQLRETGFGNGSANGYRFETGLARQFLQPGEGQNRQVLSPTKDEIGQASPQTLSTIWKIAKPRGVALAEFLNGGVAAGAADAENSTGFENAVQLPKMKRQFRIGQMLDYMMRVNRVDRVVAEREFSSKIGPHITLTGEHVGIDIDPAWKILRSTGSKMNSQGSVSWSTKFPVDHPVDSHQRSCGGEEQCFG